MATYLGHVHIAGTQRYLSIAAELLQQASLRFERFVFRGTVHESLTLGPWIRRFLLEHLVSGRNLAADTRRSYRDTLCQLLPFVSERLHKAIDRLGSH